MALKSVSDVISTHIAERTWTLAELGRRTALDHTLLSRLLRGERNWRLDHLDAIARALEVELDKLLKGTDQEHLLAAKQYADTYAEQDAEAMSEKLAEALAENRALEASSRALEEELRQRPTRAQHEALVEQHRALERERAALRKQFDSLITERNEWHARTKASQAAAAELKNELAARTRQAEAFRKAAVKWKTEAKRLGSTAEVATVTAMAAFGFAALASDRASNAEACAARSRRRRRSL